MTEPPRYRAIVNYFKEQILAGTLAPYTTLPTVRAVAGQWGVAHATAARAMRELQSEAFAYTSGKTTLVAPRGQARVTMRVPVSGQNRTLSDLLPPTVAASRGPGPDVSVVTPPGYVNQLLLQDDGEQVVRWEVVEYDGPVPARLSVHWFPAVWAPLIPVLLDAQSVGDPLAEVNAAFVALGRGMGCGISTFHARTADEREASHLRVAVGAPLLARVETFGDEQGVVRYS
jgi:GntR family transcriptional regulator